MGAPAVTPALFESSFSLKPEFLLYLACIVYLVLGVFFFFKDISLQVLRKLSS